MSDGIMNQRFLGVVPAPKLDPTFENDSNKKQDLYNERIRELRRRAQEEGMSSEEFQRRANILETDLGITEWRGSLTEATYQTVEQLAAMFDESPLGKVVTWWNAPPLPIEETRFASPGKSYRDIYPEWRVKNSIESRRIIKFAGMEFTGEQFLEAYGGDQRIMNYLNESGGPSDLGFRIEAYSKELENMGKISEAGVAGWSGYFISNMVLDPTNLVFTGAVMDIVNTGRAAKRFKQLIDAGEEVTPEQAYALYRGMTGQTIKQTMLKGGIAGVGSMASEAYFDKKVTTGDVLMAGALSMGLAGLIGGIASARKTGVSQLQGQARLYFDDIMSEATSDVPTRLDGNMQVDEVQAVLTAEASKRMNRFIREGIEAGRPMHIIAEEAISGFNKMQQMVSRISSLTFSDGKTISDLQTSDAKTVRTLYAVLGNHRLSFTDADAQLIETVSDLNARRGMAIDSIANKVKAQGSSHNHGIGKDKMAGLVIRQMEGRLDETPDDFFVKSNNKPMTEMEIEDAKEAAISLAEEMRGEVYVEYEALAGATGMRAPIENYHPRTGRIRERLEDEDTVNLFKDKYREYLKKHIDEGKLEMSDQEMEGHIDKVVASMKSGKEMKPGETTFDYDHKESGELELIEREGSEFFTQKVSETGEMQRRSLVGPTGKDGEPIDIPYHVMEDLYPNAYDQLIGSAKRHSATTNGAILSTIGAPKGQSLPEFRTAEQPFPATPRPVEGEASGEAPGVAPRVDAEDIVEGDPLATQDRFNITQSEVLYTNGRGQKVVDYIIDSPKNENIVTDASSRGKTRDASLLNKEGDIIDESYSFLDEMEGLESGEGFIWRGMNDEEFSLLQKGVVGSRGDLNIGEAQKGLTYFSEDHGMAFNYAGGFGTAMNMPTYTRPSYVVKIKRPSPKNIDEAMTYDGEVGVKNFKVDDVVEVYEVRVASEKPGKATYVETEPGSGKYKAQGSSSKVSQRYVIKKINFELDPSTPRTPTEDLTITSHAEDMTYNVIPAGKAAESDNPAQFLEDTRPVVDELNAASKNMGTAKEKEANSNMAVAEALEAERGRRTDLNEKQVKDLEENQRDIKESLKDSDSSFKEWEKSENQVDRLESKEANIVGRIENEKTKVQTRLDELEAKQLESQEQGHVPVQPDAFELNQVTDEISKLLKQDIAKKGKHQERVFNKIDKAQKEMDVLEAQRMILEWEIGGRKYDPEDTSAVLTNEIYGLTKTTIKQAQEVLGENASVKQILKNFTTRDSDKALELVNKQLKKKSEELETRIKDYETLQPQGLAGKGAEKLEKLKARHGELLEHIRIHGDKTPAEYRRSLERTRQEKIDVLRKTLDEWGDPIKEGGLSPSFKNHLGDRAGRFEELLEELRVLREPEGEGSIQVAKKASEEKMIAYEDADRRLVQDLDAGKLNKWLKKHGSDAVKKEIKELKDQLKARRTERLQGRGELSEARKRLRKASKDYKDTFGERHTLDEEVDIGNVNSRISAIRRDSSMRNMSMGIGRQDGKYVSLGHGYGKEINDEYARMIEDAGDDAALVEKLERSRDADFQKLGELRDSFLGQNGKDQSSESIVLGSQFLTSANIAISTLGDIAPTVAKSNASTFQFAESFARSLTSTLVSLIKDAIGMGANQKTVGQFAEAVQIESMKTSMSGRANMGSNQGSIRLSAEELQRSKHNLRDKKNMIWSWATLFSVTQPLVRGVAGRLHTTRALDLGQKIFYGEALSEGEAMYVRKMGMTNDELSSSYVAWVKHGGNDSVTGTGLKSASPDEWGDTALGKKFKAGVMRQVEASSLMPRKEDRMIKGGGGIKSLRNAPGFSKMDEYDKDGVFIANAINSLLSFPRTAFKEYGMKSIQHIWAAYQSKDLKGSYKLARNIMIGGSIYYAVHSAKKELSDSLEIPKRPVDPLFGSEEADNLVSFLSYTGLFGTLLDIPRTLKYAKSDYERGERSIGPALSALATGAQIASPGLGGALQVVDGMVKLGGLLLDPKLNENDVRRHVKRYGFVPVPVRTSTFFNPLLDVLIEDAVDHGVIEKVIDGGNN